MAGKRRAVSEETAFLRGDVGVDGQATEDAPDEVQAELSKAREALLRGRTWLGRECLTWLLWKSESTEPVASVEGKPLAVVFNGRLGLRAAGGDVTEMQVKGVTAPYSVLVRRALARGLLVHTAKVQLTWGDDAIFDCTLDAEFFDVRSAKLPALLQEDEGERLTERLELATRLNQLVDALVEAFVAARTAKSWTSKTVPALRAWMEG